MKRWLGHTLMAVALIAVANSAAMAQKDSKSSLDCRDSWWDGGRLENRCEVREQTLAAGGTITVDAGQNGGIAIAEVNGRIEFNCVNGGVVLRRVGGSVHGGTTNGGLVVELAGNHWDGEELDVRTTNGGVIMSVPENYSAHLETGTVNGNVSVDFPVTVQGRITRELSVNLGSGGATVRAMTTNGGVRLRRTVTNE